jgi:hypothetical protein
MLHAILRSIMKHKYIAICDEVVRLDTRLREIDESIEASERFANDYTNSAQDRKEARDEITGYLSRKLEIIKRKESLDNDIMIIRVFCDKYIRNPRQKQKMLQQKDNKMPRLSTDGLRLDERYARLIKTVRDEKAGIAAANSTIAICDRSFPTSSADIRENDEARESALVFKSNCQRRLDSLEIDIRKLCETDSYPRHALRNSKFRQNER